MRRGIKIAATLAVVLLLGLSVANAELVVIDFEILGVGGDDGPTYFSSSYSEDGYTLTTTSDFGFIRSAETDSIALFSRYPEDTITMTKDDGGIFDLITIDFDRGDAQTLTLTGIKDDTTTVNRLLTFDELGFRTYTFEEFTDLISVSWNRGGYLLFDNITVVPEPTTFLLLAIGIITIRHKTHKNRANFS